MWHIRINLFLHELRFDLNENLNEFWDRPKPLAVYITGSLDILIKFYRKRAEFALIPSCVHKRVLCPIFLVLMDEQKCADVVFFSQKRAFISNIKLKDGVQLVLWRSVSLPKSIVLHDSYLPNIIAMRVMRRPKSECSTIFRGVHKKAMSHGIDFLLFSHPSLLFIDASVVKTRKVSSFVI